MDAFWHYWLTLSQGLREGIVAGIIGGVGVAAITGGLKLSGYSLRAGFRRLFRAPVPVAPPVAIQHLPPQEIRIKVEGAQPVAPPQLPEAAPPETPTPIPSIPRPPVVGFVARRDTDGHDIVERLKEELAPEKNQLVALWGAGGVGKTTLAAEAARALREAFKGHIAWISAEGRTDFTLSTLLDEIAAYLGRTDLRPLALEPKKEGVRALLASTPSILIVLDNFETVVPVEQESCAAWIAGQANCPALITSRDEVSHARPINILAMSLTEAKEFLEKLIAQAHNPRAFVGLDHERIIGASDRIPLVLQWVIKQIDSAKQPQTALNELTQGKGDAAQRVFDRSFNLPQLGDDGRDTLLALSLFAPSATPSALAEVTGFGDDLERLQRATAQLIELCLIEATPGNERLSVEGLTRELTKSHLSRDNRAADFSQRFIAYFLRYAKAHTQLKPEDFDALEEEKDNMLSAMDRAFSLEDWASVMQLMDVINFDGVNGYLPTRGYWNEAIRRGKQALKAARQLSDEMQSAHFAHNLAITYQNCGSLTEARQLYDESLKIAKKLGDQSSIAISLHQLGTLVQEEGKVEEARKLYDDSLEIKKKLGNQSGIAITLHQIGRLAQAEGKLSEARKLYDESLEINKKLSNQRGIAISLHQLAVLAQEEGKVKEARKLYDDSLEISKRLGNQSGIALTLGQLGLLADMEGHKTEAVRLLHEALSIFERLGSPYAEVARRSLKRVGGVG
jgi:tetratricopeptide (TPR) repeat protein